MVKFVDTSGPSQQNARCVSIKTGADFLSGDQYAATFDVYADADSMKCNYETTKGWE